jgi:hypothetical protein
MNFKLNIDGKLFTTNTLRFIGSFTQDSSEFTNWILFKNLL